MRDLVRRKTFEALYALTRHRRASACVSVCVCVCVCVCASRVHGHRLSYTPLVFGFVKL